MQANNAYTFSYDPKHDPIHRRVVQANWVNSVLARKETQKEDINTIFFIVCKPAQEIPSQKFIMINIQFHLNTNLELYEYKFYHFKLHLYFK